MISQAIGSARNLRSCIRHLLSDRSGVALIEFALTFPFLSVLGMYGIEIAHMASVNMQISQIALQVADNAARLEQTSNTAVPTTVTEKGIASVMLGAVKVGEGLGLAEQGRVILSSLEKDTVSGKQFIHWQRCTGSLVVPSKYGNATTNNGLVGAVLTGMGAGTTKIQAPAGTAVMYVEVIYDYKGLFGTLFVSNTRFRQEAAYLIRDVRDLQASNQSGVTGGGSTNLC